jgi:hypothetical protein
MKKISMSVGMLMMVLAFAAPRSFAGANEQIAAMNDLMKGGQGTPVQDHHGNDVGKVVALAARNDEDAYFLVAMNGSEGKIIPIPFSAARFDPQRNVVAVLDADDSGLAKARGISPDEPDRPGEPGSDSRGHGYYGEEPGQQQESL